MTWGDGTFWNGTFANPTLVNPLTMEAISRGVEEMNRASEPVGPKPFGRFTAVNASDKHWSWIDPDLCQYFSCYFAGGYGLSGGVTDEEMAVGRAQFDARLRPKPKAPYEQSAESLWVDGPRCPTCGSWDPDVVRNYGFPCFDSFHYAQATSEKKPDPYANHRYELRLKGVEEGIGDPDCDCASWVTAIRRDHIDQLKRELDRKLVGYVDYYDTGDGL